MEPFLTRELIILRRKNRKLQKKYPQNSTCNRCNKPSVLSGHKIIYYDSGTTGTGTYKNGYSGLCDECWNNTSLDERLHYYTKPEFIQNLDDKLFYNLVEGVLKESGVDINVWLRKFKLEKLKKVLE